MSLGFIHTSTCTCPGCAGGSIEGITAGKIAGTSVAGATTYGPATKALATTAQALLGKNASFWSDNTNIVTLGTAATVNYTFEDVAWGNNSGYSGELAFSAIREAAAEAAMDLWSDVANITFTEVAAGSAKLAFRTYNMSGNGGEAASSFYATGARYQSEIRMPTTYTDATDFGEGDYGHMAMVHEVGHALGLKHPGNYNAGGGGTPGPYLKTAEDSHAATLMSYTTDAKETAIGQYASTPMIYDIQAIQALYGANYNHNSGDTTYTLTNTAKLTAQWDGGGTDTVSAAGYGGNAIIDLREGLAYYSQVGSNYMWNAFGANIENGTGGNGADTLTGNALNNVLTGGSGADTYVAMNTDGGSDTVVDDTGTLKFSDGKLLTTLTGTATAMGNNHYTLLVGKVSYDLHVDGTTLEVMANIKPKAGSSLTEVDLLNFTSGDFGITLGNATINNISGTVSADTLKGLATGDSILGGDGADKLDGGTGGGDIIDGGNGNDIITAAGKYAKLYGNADNDTLTAKGIFAYLDGGAGNDILVAAAGKDTLIGGTGMDTITGGLGSDTITLGSDGSADRVIFNDPLDGAKAGANSGYDVISGFQAGSDMFIFGGKLKTAFDDIAKDANFTFATNSAANFTTTHEGLLLTGQSDASLVTSGFAALLAAINGAGITSAKGNDGLIVVQGSSDTAIFSYTENGTTLNNISAGELTLLGLVDGALVGAAGLDFL